MLLLGSTLYANAAVTIPMPAGAVTVNQTPNQSGQTNELAQECIECNELAFNCDEEDDHFNDFIDCQCDDSENWADFCPSAVGQSGSVDSAIRTVASGATIIPATLVVTSVDSVTVAHKDTEGTAFQDAECHETFHVAGALRTNTFECAQAQVTQDEAWTQDGRKDTEFHEEHDLCTPLSCDCKHIKGKDFGEFCDCECGDDCVDEDEIADPIEDIEKRINSQIDKAISDILSDVVERCISSSLKNCISL